MRPARAFTLLEVLIVLAITVLMFAILVTIFTRYSDYFFEQQARIAVGQSAAVTMNELQRLSLQADAIVASHVFAGTSYSTSASSLILELPSVTASGDIVDGSHDYVVFYVMDHTLYRKYDIAAGSVRASGTKALTAVLQNVSFTYDNADVAAAKSITADLTTSTSVKSGTMTQHLVQRLYLHNL